MAAMAAAMAEDIRTVRMGCLVLKTPVRVLPDTLDRVGAGGNVRDGCGHSQREIPRRPIE
jgi:hypothetical protein